MKSLLILALASLPAHAASYNCDESTTAVVQGTNVSIVSPFFSAPALTVVPDQQLLPGYLGAEGEISSNIGSSQPFKGVILIAEGMLAASEKGSLKLFSGQGFRTLECSLVK